MIRSCLPVGSLASPSMRAYLIAGIAIVLLACGDSSAPRAVPTTIAITSSPGSSATAGLVLPVSPAFVVKDQSGNPMSGVPVLVTVTAGGGSIANAPSASGSQPVSVGTWTLGTTIGLNSLTISLGGSAGTSASATFSVTAAAGPIASLEVLSGENQSSLAGTPLPQPALFVPRDQYGNKLQNQTATFVVATGGGTLAAFSAVSLADGSIPMPTLTLGKSALPQAVIGTIGAQSATLHASVVTSYTMDVRFWGTAMTADQQALFTNAAARIRGVVVGSVPTVDGTGADPAACGVSGVPILAENIPGVIIYASVQAIDGPGKVLARAGPCYTRDAGDLRTAVGMMQFDEADLGSLSSGGSLQDVITHEMLHVVGVGSFWNSKGLLTGYNTASVAYIGAEGVIGCRATGGTTSCATEVPVENVGGAGTINSHWRESVFGSELMTGYANAGPMPLSIMTARSLTDLGYTSNPAAADSYSIFAGSLRANSNVMVGALFSGEWEQGLAIPHRPLPSRAGAARRETAK